MKRKTHNMIDTISLAILHILTVGSATIYVLLGFLVVLRTSSTIEVLLYIPFALFGLSMSVMVGRAVRSAHDLYY